MHFIPGLQLRASEESEIIGIDDAEMGEFAYDYVGIEAELGMKDADYREGAAGGGREPRHSMSHHHHDIVEVSDNKGTTSSTTSDVEKPVTRQEVA